MGTMEFLVVLTILTIGTALSEEIDADCVLESTGSAGKCKLLTDCPPARHDLVINQRLPQTCGVRGTQAIVCCPTDNKRKPGLISKTKCRKYSSYAYEKSEESNDECGHNIVKRLLGGVKASRKEFAHMVALGYDDQGEKWVCGGIIISDRYILTAAQCLISKNPISMVKVGVTNIGDTDHKQEIKVEEIIPHPKYKIPVVYNDIGLVKLEKPIKFNVYARPACLYTDVEISVQNSVATGWGRTSFSSEPSEDLLKVTLNFFDYDSCNKSYKNVNRRKMPQGILKDSQLCAGSADGNRDTCNGDSGGPLQIYHVGDDVKCMYDVIGITSFGKSCGLPNTPAIYTKVSPYVAWIENIVWPESTSNED